jgi:hypothetical protein
MMKIIIDDNIPDKLTRIKIELIHYSMALTGSQCGCARYLGTCDRTIRAWIAKYPELHQYKSKAFPREKKIGNSLWDMYEDDPRKWKTLKIEGADE